MAEAYFTALVVQIDTNQKSPPAEVPARYFTLELGFSLEGEPRTVFCEWTKDDSHVNFGDGPKATLPEFVGKIASCLESKST
jgi:hypothetical protein